MQASRLSFPSESASQFSGARRKDGERFCRKDLAKTLEDPKRFPVARGVGLE